MMLTCVNDCIFIICSYFLDETESMSSYSAKEEEEEKIDVVEMTEEGENKLLFPEAKAESEENGDKSTVTKEERSIEGSVKDSVEGDLDDRLLDSEEKIGHEDGDVNSEQSKQYSESDMKSGEPKEENDNNESQVKSEEERGDANKEGEVKSQEETEDANNDGEVKSEEETEDGNKDGEVKSEEETEDANKEGEVKSEEHTEDHGDKGEVNSEEETTDANNEGEVKSKGTKEGDESKIDPGEQFDNENELTTIVDVHKEFDDDKSQSQVIVVNDDPKLNQTCLVKVKGIKGKPTNLPGKKRGKSGSASAKSGPVIPKGASATPKAVSATATKSKIRKVSESTMKKREKRRQAVATGKFILEDVQIIDLVDSSDEEDVSTSSLFILRCK